MKISLNIRILKSWIIVVILGFSYSFTPVTLFSQKKVNDQERIEKYCKNNETRIIIAKYNKQGFLIQLVLFGEKENIREVQKIDLTNFKKLQRIGIGNYKIRELQLPKTLKMIRLVQIYISKLVLRDFEELDDFRITDSRIDSLTLAGAHKLSVIVFRKKNNIKSIHLENLKSFRFLELNNSENLTQIVLKDLPILYNLSLTGSDISKLKLLKLPNLKKLDIRGHLNITQLDLRNYPKLKELYYADDFLNCKLKLVLLHPKNQTHKGVTKIIYTRKNGKILSKEYFDQNGKYIDDPVIKNAKITYTERYDDVHDYSYQVIDKTYKAIDLNTFLLKGLSFKQISRKIYPSLINKFRKPVIGLITIQNPQKEPITLEIKLISPDFKTFFKSNFQMIGTKITFKPGEKKTLRVYLPFRSTLWDNIYDKQFNGTIEISGKAKSGMKAKTHKQPFKFTLMAMKKMQWDDIRNVAPFGSMNDPVVVALAKQIENMNDIRHPQVPPTIDRAMKAYELIRAMKIKYSSMPRGSTDDEVQTPSQMMMNSAKTGKCTDTTILYGTLLQRLGYSIIITTFDYKSSKGKVSHLMLLIDTGVKARDYRFLHHNKDKLFTFSKNSRCYIPIETTALTSGMTSKDVDFLESWEKGLTQVNQHRDQILISKNSFRLGLAWHRGFSPMKPISDKQFDIDKSVVERANTRLKQLQEKYVSEYLESKDEFNKLKSKLDEKNYESVFKLANYLFTVRRYVDSKEYFKKAVKLSPDNPEAHYYYTAAMVYMSLSKDVGYNDRKSAKKELKNVMNDFSKVLIKQKGKLTLKQQWYMNYDLSKWMNRLGDKTKAKYHKRLSDKAQKKQNNKKVTYSSATLRKLKSNKWNNKLVKKLKAKGITEKTVLHLIKQNFKSKLVSKLLDKGYKDSILNRLVLKKLSKKELKKQLKKLLTSKYIRNKKDIVIKGFSEKDAVAIAIKGFSESEEIAHATKGFSEEEVVAIAIKGFSEEEEISIATKGFSEEDSLSIASKGFSEEEVLANATKGQSEEVWSVSK